MAISQGEEAVIKSVRDAQNSANMQSSMDVSTFKKYFGPKLEDLTNAINSASNGSSFLSKVIVVAIVGTVITALQWYSAYGHEYDFTQYNDKQLECIIDHAKDQNEIVIDAVIEMCSRKLP